MKLTTERRWWLSGFAAGGWTMGRPNMAAIGKWKAHSAALVKMGLLEVDEYSDVTFRITDAGRLALQSNGGDAP